MELHDRFPALLERLYAMRLTRVRHSAIGKRACFATSLIMLSETEVIRKLKAGGFVERRTGKGSHKMFVNPQTGKEVWVTVHGHDAGNLGKRILKDAGGE